MAKVRIGINGFGRIGRGFVRALAMSPEPFDLALINDLTDAKALAHLLKYDSVHGPFPGTVEVKDNMLVINGDAVTISAESDPAKVPWKDAGVDIVLECTGRFTARADAAKHLAAGAKKVLISAPAKGPDATLACGINLDEYDPANHHVISNASCTTNCLAPVVKVLHDTFGLKTGLMTTIHSYTNDQKILDLPHKDPRRSRAAAMSMIPTTTGAAKAIALVMPAMEGKLDGMAIRVPTPNVSLVDLTVILERSASAEEINKAFTEAANGDLKGILGVSDEPLVSIDYNGNQNSATVDLAVTNTNGDQVKILAWYDNEAGYSKRLFDLAAFVSSKL
ncbi:MAG: type I glyceraldehyde-3-phosphate dehydrogenase [Myxococcales bacterium]|nr:type I glyceraldehyde-3-phosphate dehydrogenase [Myxococcales bacterium]